MKFSFKILLLIAFFTTRLAAQTVLSSEVFSEKMQTLENVQILDVRTPQEFAEGHLKNSKNIDFKNAKFVDNLQSLDKSKPVMVYCLAGSRSASAAKLLAENGFTEIYDLDGGYMKWTTENKEVVGVKSVAKAKFVGMSVEEYNSVLDTDKPVLVDFTATWCKPCVAFAPAIKRITNEYKDKAVVKVIDVTENKSIAKHLGVAYLPHMRIYKGGEEVWSTNGAVTEAQLRKLLNSFM